MPAPAITLSFILATLYGALFHLIFGGDLRRMALFLLAGWSGFALGQTLGATLLPDFLALGSVRLLPASAGSLAALLLTHILTRRRLPR